MAFKSSWKVIKAHNILSKYQWNSFCFTFLYKISWHAETKNNFTALHFATYSGNVGIATLLIKNGLNVNAKDLHGQTPLHIACSRFGSFDIIKMFLDKAIQNQITIDFNATDVYERTPLNVAEEKGFERIAILIRNVMKKHLS